MYFFSVAGVCLFVGLVLRPANSSMSSFQTGWSGMVLLFLRVNSENIQSHCILLYIIW